jgi:hypothetical protein
MHRNVLALALAAGLLFSSSVSAAEVLVGATATRMDPAGSALTGRQAVALQNLGPLPIYCQLRTSTGLVVGKAHEVPSGDTWVIGATASTPVYCIAAAAQLTGAATSVEQAQAFGGATVSSARPGTRFSCGVTAQAASLLQCAAVVAGQRYYITDIVAQSSTATAGDFALQSGTGTNCGTATATVFPAPPMTTTARFKAPANTAPPMVVAFSTPLVVTSAHALCAIGAATNTLNLQVSGYTAP